MTIKVRHRLGGLMLDVDLRLNESWTVLFGPSGSGKTTILRALAGFMRPDEGRITVGEDVYFNSASRFFVAPHLRRVRSAGQGGRLFPHMTVIENVVYGASDGWEIAEQVMESFRIGHLGRRRPRDLSGGEQQRACVARALVAAMRAPGSGDRPLLLLDEPLSGLNLEVRDEMVSALRRWTSEWKIPVISVTHSLGEAFQLDAEIVRIADGRVMQQGPAATVLAEERRHLLRLLGES